MKSSSEQTGSSYIAGLKKASSSLGSFAVRPVLPFEALLGHMAFLVWLIQGHESGDQSHFQYPNDSARQTAILFMAHLCGNPVVVRAIQSQAPEFNPRDELRWAEMKADHADWKTSVTRHVVMLCRTFAYQFSGMFDEGLEEFVRMHPGEAAQFNEKCTASALGTDAANEISRLSVEAIKAAVNGSDKRSQQSEESIRVLVAEFKQRNSRLGFFSRPATLHLKQQGLIYLGSPSDGSLQEFLTRYCASYGWAYPGGPISIDARYYAALSEALKAAGFHVTMNR